MASWLRVPGSRLTGRLVAQRRAVGRRLGASALGEALAVAHQTRVTGLAAEAGFWAIFALPWLFLGLVAGISHLERWVGVDAADELRDEILQLADQVLTQDAIDDLLVPLLDSILLQGRTSVGALSLVAAVWAGSRVIDTLVDGMTIVYQREGLRSFVRTKVVAVAVYVAGLLALIVAIPLVLTGPTVLARLVPGAQGVVTSGLLLAAEVGIVLVLLVALYHWAVPHRTRWWADIPGALLALGLWVVFSWALRWYFAWLFREGSVYGVISAPIAIMMWIYVTCLSLFLGAALNGALAIRRAWFVPAGPVGAPSGEASQPSVS